MSWSTLVLVISIVVYDVASSEPPVAQTSLGKYKGHFLETFEGRQIAAFNGIRYAKTPKRFQEAEKVEAHEGILEALEDGEDCLQILHAYNKYSPEENHKKTMLGSEDCLFLNVYTPNLKGEKGLPVMVWIHGGGFMIGTGASIFHGPQLLLDRDVVLVSINYRLGIFGFLSYDDDVLPGNLGLMDQSLAIRWVKENIAGFGGDPESITIFGESAGAAAVHMQMHSPRNKGLFQRAISQSGSMECPWAFTPKSKAKKNALDIARFLQCPESPKEMLQCLQEKTSEQIMAASTSLKKSTVPLEMIFKPVLESKEGGFIREEDMRERSQLDWLGGVNTGEGIVFYMECVLGGDRELSFFNKNYKQIMPEFFGYESHPQADKITQLIKHNYFKEEDIGLKTLKNFINMLSDGLFIRGQLKSALKHEGQHYLYLFTHTGQHTISSMIQAQDLGLGVAHGDELFYMFPMSKFIGKVEFNPIDLKVKNKVLDMWTNFAIHGNPTPNKNDEQWYESENGKLYVTIGTEGIELGKHMYSTRLNMWDNLPTNMYNHQQAKDEL